MSTSLLIVSRQPPGSGLAAREALDIALAGGAFDLPVGVLFLDDGVLQLMPAQRLGVLQQKDLSANLQALPLFGVESLYASSRSLAERGLSDRPLVPDVRILDDEAIVALFDHYHQVITL